MKQLTMFPEAVDYDKEIDKLREDLTKLRKSLYANQSDLRKLYQEIAHEHQIMKLNICKGRLIV